MKKHAIFSAAFVVFILALLTPSLRYAIGGLAWKKFHYDVPASVLGGDAGLFTEMGNYFFKTNHYDINKAKRYFSKAVSIDTYVPYAHYQLARIYFLQSDFQRALWEIDKEIFIHPDFRQSYYVRGLIEGYAGDFDSSSADFEKFISFYPFDWAGYNDLAWVYFRKGDYKKSEGAAMRGIKATPRNADNPWLLNSAGIALMNLGNKTEARTYLGKSLDRLEKMNPEDWGKAYPGNDPAIYAEGLKQMMESVRHNLDILG